jgi:uncharacterized protein YoxC
VALIALSEQVYLVKYVKTLTRMVHNSDRSAERLSKLIEGLNNQSRAVNERLDAVIEGLNNQSRVVNERLDAVIEGLNNQSRVVNERLDEVKNQSRAANERLDKLIESQKPQYNAQRAQVELIGKLLRVVIQNAPASLQGTLEGVGKPSMLMTAIPTVTSEQDAPRPLRLICVGTGRCGTKSITHMIEALFRQAGDGRTVMHEYCAREFYQAFCDYAETADARHLAEIRRMIDECACDCVVGNGYATILPLFAERYGREVKLVHVRRADRDACIKDLVKNCVLYPTAFGYYSSSSEAVVKRMAAFHFGEATREEWDRWSMDEKFGWYYDKTHALIGSHKNLFDQYVELQTECLDDEDTRRKIACLVLGSDSVVPPPAHLNAHSIDIASYPKEHRPKMQWLLGWLNLHQLVADDVYAIEYFLNKFIAWTGYQIRNSPQLGPSDARGREEIATTLDRAHDVVLAAIKEIEGLKEILAEHED